MIISVIIPAKNEEAIILKTLQKFEESWIVDEEHEILIINDNSSDKTTELVNNKNFEKLKIVLINNPKIGLGSAITCGIDRSSKEFISIYSVFPNRNLRKKFRSIILIIYSLKRAYRNEV